MRALSVASVMRIAAVREKTEPAKVEGDGHERQRALNLQRCVLSLAVVKDPTAILEGADGVEVWRATHELVKGLSELLLKWLPSFWRLGKGFVDGKYKKVRRPSLATERGHGLTQSTPAASRAAERRFVNADQRPSHAECVSPESKSGPRDGPRRHPDVHHAPVVLLHALVAVGRARRVDAVRQATGVRPQGVQLAHGRRLVEPDPRRDRRGRQRAQPRRDWERSRQGVAGPGRQRPLALCRGHLRVVATGCVRPASVPVLARADANASRPAPQTPSASTRSRTGSRTRTCRRRRCTSAASRRSRSTTPARSTSPSRAWRSPPGRARWCVFLTPPLHPSPFAAADPLTCSRPLRALPTRSRSRRTIPTRSRTRSSTPFTSC